MSSKRIYEWNIKIGGNKVVFTKRGPAKDYDDDLDENKIKIELQIAKIFQKVLRFIDREKDLFKQDEFELLGSILFKIIFGGVKGGVIHDLIFREIDSNSICRFYLEFDSDTYVSLPWEYISIRDEKGRQLYLSANKPARYQLIRRVSLKNQATEAGASGNGEADHNKEGEAVYVILILSNKENKPQGIMGRSEKNIIEALNNVADRKNNKFFYQTIDNPTLDVFKSQLYEKLLNIRRPDGSLPPYIIHYFGHARLNGIEGEMVFYNKTDGAAWIRDHQFAGKLDEAYLNRIEEGMEFGLPQPQMVVLQACDSAKIGQYKEGKGVALCISQKGIPSVLGMQSEINPAASSAFFQIFYNELADGKDVAEAVTLGRYYFGTKDDSGNDFFRNNLFGNPVLFLTANEPPRFIKAPTVTSNDDEWVACPWCNEQVYKREAPSAGNFCQKCGQRNPKIENERVGTGQLNKADKVKADGAQDINKLSDKDDKGKKADNNTPRGLPLDANTGSTGFQSPTIAPNTNERN